MVQKLMDGALIQRVLAQLLQGSIVTFKAVIILLMKQINMLISLAMVTHSQRLEAMLILSTGTAMLGMRVISRQLL